MSAKDKNTDRFEFVENLQMPYAVFKKDGENYILSDSNVYFKEIFDISEFDKDIKSIFINEKDEIVSFLDKLKQKDKLSVYHNKSDKCFEFSIYLINDSYHFIATDCTEIQNLKNAWKKSEALYKVIFNSGNQAIVFLDKQTRISAFNKYAEELANRVLGMNLQLNKRMIDLLPDDEIDNFSSHFMEALGGKKVTIERQKDIQDSFRKDWFELLYQGVDDLGSGVRGVCVIINNITKRKRYEQEMKDLITALKLANKITDENMQHIQTLNDELAESEIALKELNAKKDKFFSIIAHDLKNPFQGFLGLTKDLADNFHKFNLDELNEYFSILHSNAKQLFKLLENLLLWSRVQRNSIDYEPENLRIFDLININIDIQKININNKQLKITNDIPKDIEVFADLNMLNTIIRNLLSNAIKFTPKNGEITFRAIDKGSYFCIELEDTGVGMDEETQNKLFRIDTQITTNGTDDETGTGLGLILCKELVEKNRGKIFVESLPGKGTTFKFTIPAAKE